MNVSRENKRLCTFHKFLSCGQQRVRLSYKGSQGRRGGERVTKKSRKYVGRMRVGSIELGEWEAQIIVKKDLFGGVERRFGSSRTENSIRWVWVGLVLERVWLDLLELGWDVGWKAGWEMLMENLVPVWGLFIWVRFGFCLFTFD